MAFACALVASGCSGIARDGRQPSAHAGSTAIWLSPDPASATTPISVVLADRGIDPLRSRFAWRRNGLAIADADTRSLDPSQFAKGDRIEAIVTAFDPSGRTSRTLNAQVLVVNSPPRISRVSISMVTGSGAAQLQANVECADPDGDKPVYSYHWFRNDHPIDGATGATLSPTAYARGDRVVAEVVASDEQSQSPPVRSEPFSVEDRPPQFTSQPYAPRPSDTEFHYQAVASDPDGETLRYELVNGPAGMTVGERGDVSWTLPTGAFRSGDFPVRIRATDSKGAQAVQDFTIHLDPAPAPPASPAPPAPPAKH
jgi:hypothetical protein